MCLKNNTPIRISVNGCIQKTKPYRTKDESDESDKSVCFNLLTRFVDLLYDLNHTITLLSKNSF